MALLHATQFYTGVITAVNPTKFAAYTVAAGQRIILRAIDVRNYYSGTNTFYVYIGTTLVYSVTLAAGGGAGSAIEWRPWIVMTPSQVINLCCSNATGAGVVVSGSVYTI